jgi:hypothetical protein
MSAASSVPLQQRLLLSPQGVWQLLSIGKTKFYEWKRAMLLPAPVEIDGTEFYRRDELVAWVHAGAPCQDEWRWRPSLPAKLEQYLSVLREEVADLQAQIADLEGRKARGENDVAIRAR